MTKQKASSELNVLIHAPTADVETGLLDMHVADKTTVNFKSVKMDVRTKKFAINRKDNVVISGKLVAEAVDMTRVQGRAYLGASGRFFLILVALMITFVIPNIAEGEGLGALLCAGGTFTFYVCLFSPIWVIPFWSIMKDFDTKADELIAETKNTLVDVETRYQDQQEND